MGKFYRFFKRRKRENVQVNTIEQDQVSGDEPIQRYPGYIEVRKNGK